MFLNTHLHWNEIGQHRQEFFSFSSNSEGQGLRRRKRKKKGRFLHLFASWRRLSLFSHLSRGGSERGERIRRRDSESIESIQGRTLECRGRNTFLEAQRKKIWCSLRQRRRRSNCRRGSEERDWEQLDNHRRPVRTAKSRRVDNVQKELSTQTTIPDDLRWASTDRQFSSRSSVIDRWLRIRPKCHWCGFYPIGDVAEQDRLSSEE